jgi:DNA-binding MarR family transcriptional regulator
MISARVARFLSPMWESRYGLSVDTWRILAVINRYGPVSAKEVAA